jgi:hypothetical protein
MVNEIRFLVREFVPAARHVLQTPTELVLPSDAYMPALARAARLGSAAIFVHSHPTKEPHPSERDHVVDEQLRSVFQTRTRSPFYGSVVLQVVDGELSFTGRVWRGEESLGPVVLLREFGERFRFTSSLDAPAPMPAQAVFDRQVLAFGDAIQQLLAALHVGITGGGGTGSAIGEQLIRAGVGRITIVDPQELEYTNVTRVYGSSLAQAGDKKTEVFEKSADRIGLGTVVKQIPRPIDRAALQELESCDLIFCCTDDHSGRFDVSRLAYWCLVPVIDLGAALDPVTAAQQGIYSRVDIFMPGTPCPQCTGLSDPEQMRIEGLPQDEREGLVAEGYLPGQDNPDPAVIAFTTLAASLGFAELLLRLTGLASGAKTRLLFHVHERRLATVREKLTKHWCSDPLTWGAVTNGKRYLGALLP